MAIDNKKNRICDICIDGKRISTMREIAKSTFEDSFICIEVKMKEGIFVVRIDDNVDKNKLNKFTDKYKLCKVMVYRLIDPTTIENRKNK